MNVSVRTENIRRKFGDKTVLDGIDLEIREGEIFGLLGPSGAGKTTLIKILTGQLTQDSGTAFIGGIDSRALTGEDRKRFGITMDNFGVYERLSCYENLNVIAGIYGVGKAEIMSVLGKVGLAGAAKTPAGKLSKGMTVRLKLARAFMSDPDILFLDEPTSGLDPVSSNEIHKMILAEKERGKTVFLTTHDMSEAEKLCGSIALLHEGKIVEYGVPQEICRRYDHQRRFRIHLTDGEDMEIPHNRTAADILSELITSGRAETIHTTEPDLETVFMELTGKELSA